MDQFILNDFNQATTLKVYDKERIKNLVANARLGKVSILEVTTIVIAFTTVKKNKQPQVMTYTMNLDNLTQDQCDTIARLNML